MKPRTPTTSQTSLMTTTITDDYSVPMNSMPKPDECDQGTSSDSDWKTSFLMVASPESPPPVCSSDDSTGSKTTCSTNFSRFTAESPSCSPALRKQASKDSRIQVDDWSLNVNPFGRSSLSSMQDYYPQGAEIISHRTSKSSERGSTESVQHRLMTRPKPYTAFLDDMKKREFEAGVETWKKAKEDSIMERLNREEAVILEWEVRHANKATEEMKRFEKKLEKKRGQALEKLQKSLSTIKSEANKKAIKARHEARDRMSKVSKLSIKARATNNLSCLKI